MPFERRTDLAYYTAIDREHFEPFARKAIDERDFVEPVRACLPPDWDMRRSGLWMQCTPPDACLPAQGWKIHISSKLSTARIVLSIAAAMLVASGTAFKFAADRRIHAAINGKRWPRGASGKFITVYPRDLRDFQGLVGDLQAVLSGYKGPYILSDRRCPGSRIIHYRFGGIRGVHRISAGGKRDYVVHGPEGESETDSRAPYARLPAWVRDPFPREATAADASTPMLGDGRYEIRKALAFSAAGGIYLAHDRNEGRRVILKEARPHIGGAHPATHLLMKEFRLLRRLAPLGVTPAPVQYFVEWEHHYLVEEYIVGQTLREWLAGRYPWMKTRATRADVAGYLDEICAVFTLMARAMAAVHAAGISLGDPSFHNFMIDDAGEVRIIDLEAAAEDGVDAPGDMRTPGFACSPRCADHAQALAEDRYAFGANLFAALIPVNAMLPLDRHAAMRFSRLIGEDMGYPAAFVNAVGALLSEDAARRPSPEKVMAGLRASIADLPRDEVPVPHRRANPCPASDAAGELFGYIDAMAAKPRGDRYVPADPEVFERHPWGVAFGAAGILHAYLRGRRTPPPGLLGYLLDGARHGRDRGSDLMHGDAGIAWVLLEAGECEAAATLLAAPRPDDAIAGHAGLYDGIAGWGLARLFAWRRLRKTGCEATADAFLLAARVAGDMLLGTGTVRDGKRHWHTHDSQPIGLGHGAAGTALFLLHLFLACGDGRFMRAAAEALAFDLSQQARNAEGEPIWPRDLAGPALLPYQRYGTAGVLAVVARFYAATGDEAYRAVLLDSEAGLMHRHAVSPHLSDGLAGIGETLLDLARVMPERSAYYLGQAHRLAGGIEPFLVRRPGGLAVPGTELLRLSCDLATGNAGVAAFFDRLWRGGPASFMLDEALPAAMSPALPVTA
ncbi:MAG: class III lanthionine synthetase LanKC [Luteibacter sp.]